VKLLLVSSFRRHFFSHFQRAVWMEKKSLSAKFLDLKIHPFTSRITYFSPFEIQAKRNNIFSTIIRIFVAYEKFIREDGERHILLLISTNHFLFKTIWQSFELLIYDSCCNSYQTWGCHRCKLKFLIYINQNYSIHSNWFAKWTC